MKYPSISLLFLVTGTPALISANDFNDSHLLKKKVNRKVLRAARQARFENAMREREIGRKTSNMGCMKTCAEGDPDFGPAIKELDEAMDTIHLESATRGLTEGGLASVAEMKQLEAAVESKMDELHITESDMAQLKMKCTEKCGMSMEEDRDLWGFFKTACGWFGWCKKPVDDVLTHFDCGKKLIEGKYKEAIQCEINTVKNSCVKHAAQGAFDVLGDGKLNKDDFDTIFKVIADAPTVCSPSLSIILPPTSTDLTHGICVQGAWTASATSTDSSLTYTPVNPIVGAVKAWDDRDYVIKGLKTTPCANGIFLRPSKCKDIQLGTSITLDVKRSDSDTMNVCVFVAKSEGHDGNLTKSLPGQGFTDYGTVSPEFIWGKSVWDGKIWEWWNPFHMLCIQKNSPK